METSNQNRLWAEWFLRIALAAGFLSAVADLFGIWRSPGAAGVAWGDWSHFLDYVAVLNAFAPAWLIPVLGWVATIAEIGLAATLLVGWRLRWTSAGAGILLLLFALAMTFSSSLKAPLDASVYTASAGAFLLAMVSE